MKCVHQGALRLVERFRKMCKEAIEDDPLQPVAIIYEENLSKIKGDLGTAGVEPTEFDALVPNFLAMAMEIFFLLGIVQTTFGTWTCLDLDHYPPSNLWNQSKSQIICWRAIHPTICDIWIR